MVTEQFAALHGSRNGGTNSAVEPVIVRLLGTRLTFVNASTASFGFDVVFRGQMFCQIAVSFGGTSEDGQAAAISHRDTQSRVDKRLPPVGVVEHVADRLLAVNVGNALVKSTRSPGRRRYSLNGRLDAPTNRPRLGMITAACRDCWQN